MLYWESQEFFKYKNISIRIIQTGERESVEILGNGSIEGTAYIIR